MPNWCQNTLRIVGDKKDLEEFKKKATSIENEEEELARKLKKKDIEPLDANQFLPYPKKYRILDEVQRGERTLSEEKKLALELKGFDTDKSGFSQGGHKWCNRNWGTKWGFCRVDVGKITKIYNDLHKLEYSFDSAWGPPEPVVVAMGEEFPSLDFELRYLESGMGFKGYLIVSDGEVHEDVSEDIEWGNADMEEQIKIEENFFRESELPLD